jgi:F-box-like
MGDVLSSLETMQDRRDNIIAAISDTFCLLGPFRPSRIPIEILQTIFHVLVIDMLSSPCTLAAVCRSWRRAALSTLAIWSRIAIQPSRVFKSGHLFTPDGYKICSSRTQLRSALWRTRHGPLRLRISGRYLREDRNRMAEMLPLICGETSRRWQSVDLDISPDCDLSPMIPLFLTKLEYVSISTFNAPFFVALDDAVNLTSFSVTPDLRTLTVLQRSSIWPRLKTLTLMPPVRARSVLNETQALQTIVGLCQSLRSLTLHTQGTVFIPNSPQLTLPSLTFTRLDIGKGVPCRPYLSTSLTHLVIAGSAQCDSSIPDEEAVLLPHLTHLTLHGNTSLVFLPGFVCPSLDTLTFRECNSGPPSRTDSDLSDIWIGHIGPGEVLAPKKLHLRQLDISPFALCACLDNIPALEELYMEEVHMSSSFFAVFLGGEWVGEGQEPMCPNLQHFEYKITQMVIGTSLGNSMEMGAIEAIVRGAMENKDSGKRLQTAILELQGRRIEYQLEVSGV